ncbi:BRO-N domain-containing protein [Candidatus Williamhamiltonella defendens]|uniref:BRO-N domain-containing protein n=1 Tax=Candidatus Williamhamiltonella defendens TaxID=138072 RepID=UPI001581CE1D|nr:BRO family protein [Candidatus Hamiltonella defensa]
MSHILKTPLMLFQSAEANIQLQGMLYQGKPVFFAVELAKALGYKNPHEALQDNCKLLIKINSSQTLELNLGFKPKGIILAPESDLYRLILKSKLPSAERVQDWVCEEVLPTLRQQGSYSMNKTHRDAGSGLPEFRKARAMQIQMEIAEKTFQWATGLSDIARQAVIAGLINPIAGHEVIPLPVIEEQHYSATQVGKIFHVSANKIGRIANDNHMKTDEYGEYYLDTSRHSSKQVESFRYNEKAVKKFKRILMAEKEVKNHVLV